LHLGNARTFLLAWLSARSRGGSVLLRIEDIDGPRVKPEAAAQTIEDLRWLGLDWDGEVVVQSARLDRYRAAADRLLARGATFRLSAETLRDQALAVAGLLAPAVGGPSVMPPQPDGVWQVVYSGDAWKTSEGEDRYRRAIYTFLRRSSPYPSFIAFDATSRETCTVRRTRTNTPLAALVTLNDPVYLECAQALAVAVRDERDDARAVRDMFARALGRAARDDEAAVLLDLVRGERARYAGRDELARVFAGRAADGSRDLARDAARTAAANAILNLDDFLTRP
jgi:hypothetical protein